MLRNFASQPAAVEVTPGPYEWMVDLASDLARRWWRETAPIRLYPAFRD